MKFQRLFLLCFLVVIFNTEEIKKYTNAKYNIEYINSGYVYLIYDSFTGKLLDSINKEDVKIISEDYNPREYIV